MIDSHCHLEMKEFDRDFDGVIKRMAEAGVTHAVSIGSIAIGERIERTLSITGSYDFIYATLGVHPKSPYESLDAVESLFVRYYEKLGKKIVAVGETGLDYFIPEANTSEMAEIKEKQKELFRFQLEISQRFKLPVIVHVRDAYEDAIAILREFAGRLSFSGGVIHCFSSADPAVAYEFLKMGFFISFSGNVTYKKNDGLRAVAKEIPAEKILLETDSPFLAPQQFRGGRNEPSYVKLTAEAVANAKGIEIGKFSELTVQNTVNLFSLEGVSGFYPGVAYKIRNSVYLNLTNKCTNRCVFCPKIRGGGFNVRGYNLELKSEPSAEEAFISILRYNDFNEIVFCGLGEPTLRLETLKAIAGRIKAEAGVGKIPGGIKVRLDTDGLASAVHKRNVAKELKGLIDSVSISVNAHSGAFYDDICKPQIKTSDEPYLSVLDFARECKKYIPDVTLTAVGVPGLDAESVENFAKSIGAYFKLRKLDDVG